MKAVATKRAADGGLTAAQVDYAVMLFKGRGVAKDEAAAAGLFSQAAQKGNPIAQNRFARLLAHGIGVKQDLRAAAQWHLLARAAGVSDFWLDLQLAKLSEAERLAAERAAHSFAVNNRGR